MTIDTPTIRRGYATTPHGQVHYVEAGDGPPLLLLSESPRTHRQFHRVLPRFANHFRTIAVDTPGYGQSHAAPQPVTIDGVAATLMAFLDSMGLERVRLFGVNTGNKLGAALAARWPERIEQLVLVGYTHSIIPNRDARNAAILPIFERYAPRYSPTDDGAHLARQWIATQSYANGLWWPPRLLTAGRLKDEDIAGVESEVIDYLHGWRNVVAMYQAVFDFDLEQAYRRIKAPTLVLELTSAQEHGLGLQAETVAQMIPGGKAVAVDVGLGTAFETDADAIVDATLPFLLA
jgi:pimeloyl-ACP methyl ester carboxylesterase